MQLTEGEVRRGPHINFVGGKSVHTTTLPYNGIHWHDRKLLVTGCGHSGSNLLTDIVRAANYYNFTPHVEDRDFCDGVLPLYIRNYATKLCLDNPQVFPMVKFHILMDKCPNLKVLVAIRHPVDTTLSWMYRERPIEMGGDSTEIAPEDVDLGPELKVARWQAEIFPNIMSVLNEYGRDNRSIGFRMEDIIRDTESTAKQVAGWLEIPYVEAMSEPWKISRHEGQLSRYRKKLNKEQIDVYKRWKTEYNGFFADKRDMVAMVMENLTHIAAAWGYDVDMGVL